VANFKIRAVTLHYGLDWTVDVVEDMSFKLLEARDRVSSSLEVSVESVRLTLASLEGLREAVEASRKISNLDLNGVFVNIGGYRIGGEEDVGRAADVAESGVFMSILYSGGGWGEARLVSRVFHEAASRSPDYPVHIAFNPSGKGLFTPYYPLSYAERGRTAVTVALLYPRYLSEAYRSGGIEMVKRAAVEAGRLALKVGEEVSKALDVGGGVYVDLSVSPWMEETVLGLVEEVAGVRLPEPGFAWGVAEVNEAILSAAEKLGRYTGFNEVQLPVAEDLKLKLRVAEGETRARDLLRLAGSCLAGLDMAVVPSGVDQVAGLVLESVAYTKAKGRVVGLRVIPVDDVEPGDRVYLERFGEVPVIPV